MNSRIMKTLVAVTALSVVPVPALGSPPEPAPPAIAPPPPPPEPVVTRSTVALVAAGVAVAAAAGATVFGVLTLQSKSAYDAHPTYANVDNGTNDAAYADGCIALAVAAGVTSLILYLTRDTTTPTPRSAVVSATPIVTPHGGGAGFVLRF